MRDAICGLPSKASSQCHVDWLEGAGGNRGPSRSNAMLADDSEGGEQEGGLSLPALKTGREATVKTVWPWQSSACLWQDPPHTHLAGAAAQSENSTVRLMFFIYWQLLTDMEKNTVSSLAPCGLKP